MTNQDIIRVFATIGVSDRPASSFSKPTSDLVRKYTTRIIGISRDDDTISAFQDFLRSPKVAELLAADPIVADSCTRSTIRDGVCVDSGLVKGHSVHLTLDDHEVTAAELVDLPEGGASSGLSEMFKSISPFKRGATVWIGVRKSDTGNSLTLSVNTSFPNEHHPRYEAEVPDRIQSDPSTSQVLDLALGKFCDLLQDYFLFSYSRFGGPPPGTVKVVRQNGSTSPSVVAVEETRPVVLKVNRQGTFVRFLAVRCACGACYADPVEGDVEVKYIPSESDVVVVVNQEAETTCLMNSTGTPKD